MAFSTETKALMALGYSLVSINSNSVIFPPNLGADALVYVDTILSKLAFIDQEMDNNSEDCMTIKVQDLQLDYDRYFKQNRARGSRYLSELAAALSTPVAFDKYMGTSQGQGGIAIKNYY